VDTAYKSVYNEYYKTLSPSLPQFAIPLKVKEFEMWQSTDQPLSAGIGYCVAYSDIPSKLLRQGENYDPALKTGQADPGRIVPGHWIKLDSSNYSIDYNLGILQINNLNVNSSYAVAYRIEGQTTDSNDDEYSGVFSSMISEKDTILLKLVYSPGFNPNFQSLWDRQLKNIFTFDVTNLDVNYTNIKIFNINAANDTLEVLNGCTENLVTILGVDRLNNSTGAVQSDGKFDTYLPYLDKAKGIILFPSIEPFNTTIFDYLVKIGRQDLAINGIFPEAYQLSKEQAKFVKEKDKFLIYIETLYVPPL
jgi:cell surface protein SprA